ncbi:efflux RND transporter periplasmic adaptor subunit [Fluviicola taffensis]|uniref:Efflux transporter, RND family, MFP subunit n=1 Tax=Fluviicola taffensis (strain DSM 16823 / NCIMB 13979 / RW262) TaxID=755732 RepID=F2IH09_FLUTR|nr:efflux RND transporter periplasmic adaptor subunit [Fluviicola taffensis]AEA45823.1 efflux transporter, RND family, MFP subunit [Fluviicola taffensis DSM 16823]
MKILVHLIVIGFLLQACSNAETGNKSMKETPSNNQSNLIQLDSKQIKNGELVIGELITRNMHLSLQVTGVIDVHPNNSISVSAPLGGYLKKTDLIPGRKVKKGSVLAILEDQQYIQIQQDYLTAKNKLQLLESDYKRQKGLNETKVASDKTLQQVQSEYANQRILVRSLAEQLRLIGLVPEKLTENNLSRSIAIHSPISGYVSKVNINIGKYVTPSEVLFELINPEDVCVNLTVFENDSYRIGIGQNVKLKSNSNLEKEYSATIELISPNIDANRSIQVHAKMNQKTTDLQPGTFVNAEIELNDTPVLCIPSDALVKWENKEYLFVEEQIGVYRMIPVETGISNEGFTEIKSKLHHPKIVLKNAYTLLMKLKNNED